MPIREIIQVAIPMLRTGNGHKSFAYRGASLWNSLDLDTKWLPQIMPSGPNSRKNHPFLYIHL